jgi:hypothetical protein
MEESYYRSVLRHFKKYPNEHLKNMNDDDCEEEHEGIVSNAAWSETFCVRRIRMFHYSFKF